MTFRKTAKYDFSRNGWSNWWAICWGVLTKCF